MSETQFWSYVVTHCYDGKTLSAEVTCKGVGYVEECHVNEGDHTARLRLFNRLKSLGHIIPDEEYYNK